MSKGQLALAGVTPETMVWRDGLPDWVKAESLPELSDIFMQDSAFGGYARPEEQLNPYAGGENRWNTGNPIPPYGAQTQRPAPFNSATGEPVPHTNWLPWAIVATIVGAIFSCIGMIFGIIGIVKANKANNFYVTGMKAEGDVANSSARVMTIIALVLGAVGLIMVISGVGQKMLQFAMYNSL